VDRQPSAVIPYENSDSDDQTVIAPRTAKTHIRRKGEDAARGDVLVTAGRVVNGAVLGAAAQADADRLTVRRRPRVHTVITGDGVITTGIPAPGQVRDALSAIVTTLAERAGAIPLRTTGRVAD
jgi:molybdopterin molybdotransferase